MALPLPALQPSKRERVSSDSCTVLGAFARTLGPLRSSRARGLRHAQHHTSERNEGEIRTDVFPSIMRPALLDVRMAQPALLARRSPPPPRERALRVLGRRSWAGRRAWGSAGLERVLHAVCLDAHRAQLVPWRSRWFCPRDGEAPERKWRGRTSWGGRGHKLFVGRRRVEERAL